MSWFFPDEDHPDARAAFARAQLETIIVPPHWWYEVRNAMVIGERRRRFSADQTTYLLTQLASMPVSEAQRPDERDTLDLARRHRLTFYDAAYLELAQREGLALATLDDDLAGAARAEGVPLVVAS